MNQNGRHEHEDGNFFSKRHGRQIYRKGQEDSIECNAGLAGNDVKNSVRRVS